MIFWPFGGILSGKPPSWLTTSFSGVPSPAALPPLAAWHHFSMGEAVPQEIDIDMGLSQNGGTPIAGWILYGKIPPRN